MITTKRIFQQNIKYTIKYMNTRNLPIIVLLILSSFLIKSANAQTAGKGFSFQGFAIDNESKALASQNIQIRFSLTSSNQSFTEIHNPVATDAMGVFHAIIGNSTVANNANFQKLNFSQKQADDYILKVEVSVDGITWVTISNSPMNAVPYARFAHNGVPVGTIVAFAGDLANLPEGWLYCDGASVDQTTYGVLYAAIGSSWGSSGGNFNLPDLRGRFLRGVDGTANRDQDVGSRTPSATNGNAGNNVGSIQSDGFKSHDHSANTGTGGAADGAHAHSYRRVTDRVSLDWDFSGGTGWIIENYNSSALTDGSGEHSHTVEIDATGGAETRPMNAAVHYIIKY